MQRNHDPRRLLLASAVLFAACAAPSAGGSPRDHEVARILEELDRDGDGRIARHELPEPERRDFEHFDTDGDGFVGREELRDALGDDDEPAASFEADGRTAYMHGVIGGATPDALRALLDDHPNVDRIVMVDVPGSMDDEANLEAARLLRDAGIATHVPNDGVIASGGVDFFLAGARRTAERGARFGVHSWGGDSLDGRDVPRDDPQHRLYLDFYRDIGIDASFYWFTLEAAPAAGIHWMTDPELAQYHVLTEPLQTTSSASYGLDAIDTAADERGVVPLPASVHGAIRATFARYTRVVAPNGRPIHILAQAGWSTDQIVRVRHVLEHLLAPAPDSRFGADKAPVANAMADRRATMALFDDEPAMERGLRSPFGSLRLSVQDLRANECPVEGDPDYLQHDTRDAAFEEVLHLVHDYGIRPALPEYDRWIERLNRAAAQRGIWEPWPQDEPDSHRNEYLAAAYDNYLDLWTVPPTRYEGERIDANDIPAGTSHFGAFRGGSRQRLAKVDPEAVEMIEAFLPRHVTYVAELPAAFEGTFVMRWEPRLRYTTASQHLRSARLRGSRAANLSGNEHANRLFGNDGPNVLEGLGGDDVLHGGAGRDVAVLRGVRSEYEVRRDGARVLLSDRVTARDGQDTLLDVEVVRFADGDVAASALR